MLVEVLGKNGLEITPAIREYAVKKLQKIEKYYTLKDELRATVLCKVYPTYHKVEVTIPAKHFTLRTETVDKDLYASLDLSVDKLERQIKKFKTKVNKLAKEKEGISEYFTTAHLNENETTEVKTKNIVKNKTLSLVPLSFEEAIEQMEMVDHDFFVYLDNVTMKVSVLYVRKDGEYAKLDTEY